MAESLTPAVKEVPFNKGKGLPMGSAFSTISTPDPAFGRYFGSQKEAKDAVGSQNIMGKKGPKG